MLKKTLFFSVFIFLNICFYIFYNQFFKLYHYNSIIIETPRAVGSYYNDAIVKKFNVKYEIDFKLSDFKNFDKIQKWKFNNNSIMHEKVNEYNSINVFNLLDDEFDFIEQDIIFYQIFDQDEDQLNIKLNNFSKEMNLINKRIVKNCNKEEKRKKEYKKYKDNFIEDEKNIILNFLFFEFYKEYYNSRIIFCSDMKIKIYDKKTIQKYNILFLSFLSTLIIILSLIFTFSLINDFKKR